MLVALAVCMFAGCAPAEKSITVGYTIVDPLNYLDESGKLVGFDTELAEKVFGNLGYKVIFKEIEWSAKYTELDSMSIDCIWNGFTANTSDDDGIARADKVDFSYNYMENRQVLVAKKGNTIKALDDVKGKNVAAEKGSAGDTYILHEGDYHNYYSDSTAPMDKIWVNLKGELAQEIIKIYNLDNVILYKNINSQEWIEKIHNICHSTDNPYEIQQLGSACFLNFIQFLTLFYLQIKMTT